MKSNRTQTLTTILVLLIGMSFSGNAQTVYNVTTNTNSSAYANCSNCIFNISSGVTLTVNSNWTCTNCTFSGGTVNVSSGTFTLSGVDSFKNETVLLNKSFSSSTLAFYGDTIAFNATMNLSGGRTSIDSSKVSVNSSLTLAEGSFNKDSLHLNNNLTLSNSVDSFSNSNIDVATGVTVTTAQTNVINSTFAFAGSASMTANWGFTSSGSNYYLNGTSSFNSTNATTLRGDNVVLSGTTSSFTSGNALATLNTNISLEGSAGTLTAQSISTTNGSITAASGSTINSTYAASLTNTTTTLTGATFSAQSLSASSGSFTATNSTVSSTYAANLSSMAASFTNSPFSAQSLTTTAGSLSLSGSTATITFADQFTGTAITLSGASKITGQSATLSSGTNLTITGTSQLFVKFGFTSTGSTTNLSVHGNVTVTNGSMSITNGSFFQIGSGIIIDYANATISGSVSVDNTSTLSVSAYNNYLFSTTSALAHNTISCGGASPEHACTTDYLYGCATITNNIPLACTVLSVASISLTASETVAGSVALAWTDNSLLATGHYEIQRSTGDDHWTTIGTVNIDNNTTTYEFTDADAPSGRIDYRIERIEDDGKTAYSSVCSITIATATARIGIHPNPATGGRFYLTTTDAGQIVVNVYTSTGQLLLHTALQGQTEYPIQIPTLTLSLSTVVVQTISRNSTQAFTVLVR